MFVIITINSGVDVDVEKSL